MSNAQVLILLFALAAVYPFPRLLAQSQVFRRTGSLAMVDSLQAPFPVRVGDVNGDGKPDALIGTADGVYLYRGTGSARVEGGQRIEPGNAWNLVTADFDGDGASDVALVNEDGLVTLKGDGSGGFERSAKVPLARRGDGLPAGLAVADFNQDGRLDLAAAVDRGVAIYFGDGKGNFTRGQELATGESPRAIATADLNSDGRPDLVTANYLDDGISVLLSSGGGGFAAEQRIEGRGAVLNARVLGMAAGDFNGDGKVDLALAANEFIVLLGRGDGTFSRGVAIDEADRAVSLAAGDLNGDGSPDVVLGCYYGGAIHVLLNNGDGTFRKTSPQLQAHGDTFGAALADLNGDARLDLITTSISGASAMIAAGRGTGDFDLPMYLGVTEGIRLRPGDADGDGRKDLAVIVPYRKTISILRNGVEPMASVAIDDYPTDARFADFNRDGIPDLAVLTQGFSLKGDPAAIRILTGRGAGTFEGTARIDLDSAPRRRIEFDHGLDLDLLEAADFNGDGVPDVAAVTPSGKVQVFAARPDGSFSPGTTLVSPPDPDPAQPFRASGIRGLATADFDGDGIQDLAILSHRGPAEAGAVLVYPGTRSWAWTASASYETVTAPLYLLTGDFNGDAKPDAMVCSNDQAVLLLNGGGGAMRPSPPAGGIGTLSTLATFADLASSADFDGDGTGDVVLGGVGVNVHLSKGDGAFRTPDALPLVFGLAVAAEDWTGDARPDIAVLTLAGRAITLQLFQNETAR